MSGPLGEFGRDVVTGINACLERVNAAGGIHGRRLSMVTLDDQFKTEVGAQNIERLIKTDKVFALLGVMGTAISLEAAKQGAAEGIPFFAPGTGAQVVREPSQRHVFHVRAGYRAEIQKVLTHLRTIGLRKIGVVYFEPAFSTEIKPLQAEMAGWPAKPAAISPLRPDGADVEDVVTAIAKGQPEAVVLLTSGKATVDFIKSYNKRFRGTQFYTLSGMGTNASVEALGPDGVGVVVTSVVPFPWAPGIPIVKEYQEAMQKIGGSHAPPATRGVRSALWLERSHRLSLCGSEHHPARGPVYKVTGSALADLESVAGQD
jgi:branched-chain amino acid transport system substrate-binding protein